ALWLLAALLVLATAAALAIGAPTWWWILAAVAAVVSQSAIVTSWSDARAGTAVTVLLVLAAGYGFLAQGPTSLHAQWRDQATSAVREQQVDPPMLTEADLDTLPGPLAAYVRRTGAVGMPRVVSVHAELRGRIRGGLDSEWMPFTGAQLNTYGPRPQRVFLIDATRAGLPVTVLHSYADTTATMRGRLVSLVTILDSAGPDMDRGETVTVFNDLVLLAPGALVDAPIEWTEFGSDRVRGVFTTGDQSVTADLLFDASGDLVDFHSEDRLRASDDGSSFTRQPWSTPVIEHRVFHGVRLPSCGEARWLDPDAEAWFTYIELEFTDVVYNVQEADLG
ncbi:hypothetical protein G6027_16230, partial [Dietzia sp. SLG310A2-38A2]|uniref:DUF6544 family protein n=1 Tax=Dietzia sp. SLG310A2-38A2 TaxID=1630643 RepID=UPI0015F7CC9A